MTTETHDSSPRSRWITIALLCVLMLAAFTLRVVKLDTVPNGLFCDEASNGLDTYCLLKTGRSLHGDLLPMIFLQHGRNHIEGMYAYLSVPFVAMFGLSAFSARLLAAIGGTLLIATAYLASRVLIDRRAGWIAALLVAVSPWTFTLSRIAFRGILAPLFLCLGVFALVKMFTSKRYAFLAAAAFGLSLHTYSVTKAFVPFALIALGLIFLPEMKRF